MYGNNSLACLLSGWPYKGFLSKGKWLRSILIANQARDVIFNMSKIKSKEDALDKIRLAAGYRLSRLIALSIIDKLNTEEFYDVPQ